MGNKFRHMNPNNVDSVVITNANGLNGTVTKSGRESAISIGTSVTGLLKAFGGSLVSATPSTDYVTPNDIDGFPEVWKGGVMKTDTKILTFDGTITSGIFTCNLTSNQASNGTTIFTEILHTNVAFNDSMSIFGYATSISADKRTLTVSVTKQMFSGVTIAGINALGSMSLLAAPNGTALSVLVIGK